MKPAIVMVSIGDRPWADKTVALLEVYSRRIGAAFVVESSPPAPLIDLRFPCAGRPNKQAYATKTYAAWKHLENHTRVLVVDDAYVINPVECDNVFELVPEGCLGVVDDPSRKERPEPESYRRTVEFIDEYYDGERPYDHDRGRYLNSSFVLYDQLHRDLFSPARIREHSDLFGSAYPHQTFLYNTVMSNDIAICRFPDDYHLIPGFHELRYAARHRMRDIGDYVSATDKCAHFTGSYRYRKRLIRQAARLFSRRLSNRNLAGRFG